MFSSTIRRTAAAVALTTSASLVAVGAAGATTGAAAHDRHRDRIDTHLSIAAPDRVGQDGDSLLRGRLTARRVPLRDRLVVLLVKQEGEPWVGGRTERTGRAGAVSFRISPNVPTSYRLVFAGTDRFEGARSRIVQVAPRPTAVAIDVAPHIVDPGEAAVVSGVVTDDGEPVVAAPVELWSRTRGSREPFAVVDEGVTGDDGTVSFEVSPERTTAYVIHLPAAEGVPPARSRVAVVAVRAATRIVVRASKLGETYAVSGALLSRGKARSGRPVTLQEETADETWSDLKTKRTGRNGVVAFRQPFVEGTSYRLAFDGARRLAASVSRTVTS